jgi:hypothetical protein
VCSLSLSVSGPELELLSSDAIADLLFRFLQAYSLEL